MSFVLIRQRILKITVLYNIITGIILIQVLVSVFQKISIIPSLNNFFPVTGTMVNPNFTAMYLALGLPMVLYGFLKYKERQIFYILFLFLILISFVLLECRTATIAVIISTLYILNVKYSLIQKVNSKNKLLLKGAIVISLTTLITAFSFYSKIDSTNSRLFIWKHTFSKSVEKPIIGHGFNSFIREYNLMQAKYFEKQDDAIEKPFFSSHIRVAYNDYLQNFFELGFVGLFFYVGFIGGLILKYPKEDEKEGPFIYAGILTFAIMGLFNSVQFVIPIFSLFVLYAAFYIDYLERKDRLRKIYLPQLFSGWPLAILLVLLGSYLLIYQVREATSSRKLKACRDLIEQGAIDEALLVLETIKGDLTTSDDFWFASGFAYAKTGKYELALEHYEKAKKLTTTPVLYLEIGRCFYNLGEFNEAIYFCNKAVNMIPASIYPRHSLMRVYKASGDIKNTIAIANEILAITPKGNSKKANFYKEDARKVLRELEN